MRLNKVEKKITFSVADDSIEMTDRQTACTDKAGLQSSVKMLRQMWPLLYTCGCTGMLSPTNVTFRLQQNEK